MGQTPRLLAVVVLGALLGAGCAETNDEERALLASLTGDGVDAATVTELPTVPGVLTRDDPRPEIAWFLCPFDRDDVTEARCGRIELPGRGVDPDYTIGLAFVRFTATGDAEDVRPDPVVFLHGGPGSAILQDADLWYDSIVAPHIEHRDVILYDQRGGGSSTKLPVCHEASDISDRFHLDAVDHESLTGSFLDAMADCAAKFRDLTDIDLTAFNSAVNAQDLADLMWALGVGTYNIHGSSYGTRLAQTVMRDVPDGVRSLVLSGTYPIDVNMMGSLPVSMESSLNAIFAGCAALEPCAEALPDPWAALEQLVADLDAAPRSVEVGTSHDETLTLRFDGTDLLNALHSYLYVGDYAASVPDLLIDHLDGDDRRLLRLARGTVFDHTDTAAFLLVQCADEGPFTTDADLDRALDYEFLRAIDLAPSINGVNSRDICAQWDTGVTDPIENEPVTWDVPTLILSGGADPITPPGWADELADRLPRSLLVHRGDASHDSDEGWCARSLIGYFVEHPDVPLDSCAWPGELAVDTRAERFREPLEMVDTSLDLDGELVDLRLPYWPGAWHDDAHVRWRNLGPLDITALVVLELDHDYDLVAHLPFTGVIPDWVASPRPIVPVGWTRWTMATTGGDLVSYVHDTSGVEIVLVLEPGETTDLERMVLVPAAASAGGS